MINSLLTIAFKSIWSYKGRAGLTILGVIIGIGAVVIFMALGRSLTNDINHQINSLGTNLLVVIPGDFNNHQLTFNPTLLSGDILTQQDMSRLESLEGVNNIAS